MYKLKNKKILIIAPHPDDEALWSGGLIMKAKKEGANVFVLYVATGKSRQLRHVTRDTLVKDRMREVKAASAYGGFAFKIGFTDIQTRLDTLAQKDLIECFEDTIQEFKPDIVVMPRQDSYNQDHRAVAMAAITAMRPIPLTIRHQAKLIIEAGEVTSWPNAFSPNFYVDISDVMLEKLALYYCHKTQVVYEPYYRSNENLKRYAGLLGSEIGVKYAEGYRLLKVQI